MTIVGFMVGTLIAGAVVVESVFSWPGVGRLLVVAVANRDLAVVQCILLLVAATMVTSNLDRRFPLWLPRSAPEEPGSGGGALTWRICRYRESNVAKRTISWPRIPPVVAVAILWVVAMLTVAILAETIAPYSVTKMDLRNRLSRARRCRALARNRRTRPRRALTADFFDPHFIC